MKLDELLSKLKGETLETWFDLGLFLDRIREEQASPDIRLSGTYDDFAGTLKKGGIALLTFHYMVDGVTVEAEKYASIFRQSHPGVPIHFIAGTIDTESVPFIREHYAYKEIPELAGFDDWSLYREFYFTRLERGSETYNGLIKKLWQQTLAIVVKLGRYIETEKIKLLYVINVCSNPGNVAFALATVLLSEFLRIPVINNNHDFYWEGGMSRIERKKSRTKKGPRDFFFTNDHLGEFFSVVELLYPWRSRSWIQVNINRGQSDHLVRIKGHNPAGVMEIGTAVDTTQFSKSGKRTNINTFLQLEKMLSGYQSRLISYSTEDVLKKGLVPEHHPRPILIGNKTAAVNRFISENIILLQPTRIISRKRIETSYDLLMKMFQEDEMKLRFQKTAHLKMTLLITGPIASGHHPYFLKLVRKFRELLEKADAEMKERIFLAFLFGEVDQADFRERFKSPAGIAELYNISSLVLLPSKTEGRGLPIIESAACGTPVFCRRYDPISVYSEVIGEHLEERNRLNVLGFKGKRISESMVRRITERIFFPHRYADEVNHNQRVVNQRYSLEVLDDHLSRIFHRLFDRLRGKKENLQIVRESFESYRALVNTSSEHLEALLDTKNRQYLAGYSKLSFMYMLKSLIDPSFFRVEQQIIQGMAFHFARTIIQDDPDSGLTPEKSIHQFYNSVETLFEYRDGSCEIQHDHSMSYRHRNRYHYPYRDFTFQELTGLINLLYMRIVQPTPLNRVDMSPQFFTDWNLALLQLTGSSFLAIDDRLRLIERLQKNLPIAYFPGAFITYELEFFALQSIRARMRLPLEDVITRELLENEMVEIQPVYIFAQEKRLGKQLDRDEITAYIKYGASEELKLLYEFQLIQIIATKQVCVGIHFPQLGEKALTMLRMIRDRKGYILTNRSNASMMTDLVDMDRFHIGKVLNEFTAHMMGIPLHSGYIQFVPAGVRATLSYPSPLQTAKDLEVVMKSDLYQKLVRKMGERKLLSRLREDASLRGSPARHVLERLALQEDSGSRPGPVTYEYLNGTYSDGRPYSGVLARLSYKKGPWDFAAVTASDRPGTVQELARDFETRSGYTARIAWNGGYILNPELVGKLGLPESYIGSPLGLLITEGRMKAAPLFNKPALLIHNDGSIDICRVNSSGGLSCVWRNRSFTLESSAYNRESPAEGSAYYDLLYPRQDIESHGQTVVRLSGNVIREILLTQRGDRVSLVPVGLTLALDPGLVPENARTGDILDIQVKGIEGVRHAVEAGPLLLENSQIAIDMDSEGWKTTNSIRTQAARLDFTDMRGPKIAVGINDQQELAVLAINGRIRESVGATHGDMAGILQGYGMKKAMGFDPGGSSTLVVEGQTLNISPYNSRYESDVYALPPEPRAVSNAIIGFLKA